MANRYQYSATLTNKYTKKKYLGSVLYPKIKPNDNDMYKNLFGFIETMSFTIDENTPWPNSNYNMEDGKSNELYPSVVSVSIGMKIIEQHLETKGTVTKYKYDFDGRFDKTIEEEKVGDGYPKAIMPNPIDTNIKLPTIGPLRR